MKRKRVLLAAATVMAVGAICATAIISTSSKLCAAQEKTSFSEDVMPIFRGRCVGCHQAGGEGYEKAGSTSVLMRGS